MFMFEPHEILDPHERFLQPIGTGGGLKAAVAAALVRLNATRVLWLTGTVLFALSTWVLFTGSDTRQLTLESAQVLPVQSSEQLPHSASPEQSSGSPYSTPQLPQAHAGGVGQAAREREQAVPSPSDDEGSQHGGGESPASTSVQADKLEPISPAALGTPHAIVPEATLSEALASEEKESPPSSSRERVRVASAANIHSGPSASGALLGTAQVGAEAEVASRDAGWVQIIDPASGKVGWVNSKHLVPAPAGGEQSTSDKVNALPSGEQQAALADEQEAVPLPAAEPERSLKSKKKSHKYGWRKKRYKRGLALRFVLRRLR
jgi:hypothetical protein